VLCNTDVLPCYDQTVRLVGDVDILFCDAREIKSSSYDFAVRGFAIIESKWRVSENENWSGAAYRDRFLFIRAVASFLEGRALVVASFAPVVESTPPRAGVDNPTAALLALVIFLLNFSFSLRTSCHRRSLSLSPPLPEEKRGESSLPLAYRWGFCRLSSLGVVARRDSKAAAAAPARDIPTLELKPDPKLPGCPRLGFDPTLEGRAGTGTGIGTGIDGGFGIGVDDAVGMGGWKIANGLVVPVRMTGWVVAAVYFGGAGGW
jgi:hypothetical protein